LLEIVGDAGVTLFFLFDVSEKNERMTSFKNRLPGLLS
jgi:hypothetical protein